MHHAPWRCCSQRPYLLITALSEHLCATMLVTANKPGTLIEGTLTEGTLIEGTLTEGTLIEGTLTEGN